MWRQGHPTFGFVNGRPLFLDLASDTYFILDGEHEQQFVSALGSGPGMEPVDCAPAIQSILDDDEPFRTSAGDIFCAFRYLELARRSLRRAGLSGTLENFSVRPRPSRARSDKAAISRRFYGARRWLPHPVHCLTDSLALLALLIDEGSSADLVFAAKLDPFAAHCWLQSGGTLLNDRADRIHSFTPVCVVGA